MTQIKLKLPQKHTSKKILDFSPRLFCYCLLTVLAFEFLYPFFYMIATSFKSYEDIQNISVFWVPTGFNWKNFTLAADAMNFGYGIKNSIAVTLLATIGHIISCSLIGYGFARYDFPFRNVLFIGVVLSTVIPVQTLLVSQYMVYGKLKILETILPLVLPCFFGFGLRGGVYIFLFRQFFIRFPSSLEEAAQIDGCGRFKTFWRIAFPSAKAPTMVALVLSMVWHWNDYYEPKIYLTGGPKTQMLTQSLPNLYTLLQEKHGEAEEIIELATLYHEGVIMAATAIAFLPILIAFIFLQRQFMQGIERSGLVE